MSGRFGESHPVFADSDFTKEALKGVASILRPYGLPLVCIQPNYDKRSIAVAADVSKEIPGKPQKI